MANKLLNSMPPYYRMDEVMTNITATEDQELIDFENNVYKTLDQFFIV